MVGVPAVLVVGSPQTSEVGELVFEAGLTPVFRETILSTIDALRRDTYRAVVIDSVTTGADLLELILNIRDVAEKLRIFLYTGGRRDLSHLAAPPRVSVVDRKQLLHKLTPSIVELSEARRGRAPGKRAASSKKREKTPKRET